MTKSQSWGLLRLWDIFKEKKKNANAGIFREYDQSLLSPHLFYCTLFFKNKKKGSDVFVCRFYGRFLSINRANTMATMTIRTNRPAIAGTKYMSATDVGVAVGDAEGAADNVTTAAVSADEP